MHNTGCTQQRGLKTYAVRYGLFSKPEVSGVNKSLRHCDAITILYYTILSVGYSDICLLQGSDYFLGFKILNFAIVWGCRGFVNFLGGYANLSGIIRVDTDKWK